MSVKYSVVKRKNPRKMEDPAKYYAHAQAYGEMDFDALCEEVDGRCTVTRADISAVIDSVLVSMKQSLAKGQIVRLGTFGSFQIGLSSNGADTEKEFASGMIRSSKIAFRPGKMLLNTLKVLDYTQVAQLPAKVAAAKTVAAAGE